MKQTIKTILKEHIRDIIKQQLNEGATDLMTHIKTGSESKLKKWFKDKQQSDLEEYGHQQGYSGSWYSFKEYKILSNPTFNNTKKGINLAFDYVVDHASKWGPAIAVKLVSPKGVLKGFVIGGIVAE